MFIYTDIVEQFSCQMCGNCCRNDWQVTLDEASYRRNEALFTAGGRAQEFEQVFIRLGQEAGYGEYAYVAKQAGGGCWFLTPKNTCRLHQEAGHSHLDAVCQTFPRYPMNTARGVELTLSFSCPAVIKLADRQAPLRIVKSEQQPIDLAAGSYAAEVYPRQHKAGNPLHYYFEWETHFIDILQCRSLPLAERLVFLDQTISEIDRLNQSETIASQLTALFNRNYDYLDTLAAPSLAGSSALLENFLVSFVFKKPFYLYGLTKSRRLLARMWQQISQADNLTDTIMQLEFQYMHNRKTLLT